MSVNSIDAKSRSDIRFTLNDKETTYCGNPSERLLDVLRDEIGLTGTKCGCKEGECGACAVLVNGRLLNSCLVAMGSLENAIVLTIEGYSKTKRFATLDKAYASVSAVQCGFCIPGMMMASECVLASNPSPTEEQIRTGISGNLCRCTGYNSIVKAIGIAASESASKGENCENSASDAGQTATGQTDTKQTAMTKSTTNKLTPSSLKEALQLRKNTALIPYSGGTDIMVSGACAESDYLFIKNVQELRQITSDDEYIRFGAACCFTDAIEHPLTPLILKDACQQIAAPAIRNAGTLGGNIANGSAKADSALIFMVTDSKLKLASAGNERILPIRDFYLGGGKTALVPDELIVEILMPKAGIDNYYYKKVGARNALAISRTSFVGLLDIQDGIIKNCAVAFGAVKDIIIRRSDIDKMLIGKTVFEARELKEKYIAAYNEAIQPRPGRVGVEYRKDVCMNLLNDFLTSNGI